MIFAVIIFFIMSFVGCLYGHAPATCCSRALAGSIITYVAVTIAGKGVMAIIINSIIESKVNKFKEEK
jgi:hypothetical protein